MCRNYPRKDSLDNRHRTFPYIPDRKESDYL